VRARRLWLGLAVVGGIATLAAWGFSFVATAFACSWDTSYCATGETRDYRGRLFDYLGRPAAPTLLVFQSDTYGARGAGARFQSSEGGRFCVTAFEGVTTAFIQVEGQLFPTDRVVRSTAAADPRLASAASRDGIRKRERGHVLPVDYTPFMAIEPASTETLQPYGSFDAIGAYDAVELWHPATDLAPVCTAAASPRWYRFDDLHASWQYAVLMLAPAVTIVLVVAGLLFSWNARRTASAHAGHRATRVLQLACVACAATLLLTYATWTFF
jgi:hypothetical protein